MKGFCPNCEKDANLRAVRRKEIVEVRGERIPIVAEFLACRECGEEFQNTRGADHLEAAYREYRQRHSMLQPEEIKDWRNRYGLTQREVADLLGLGGATLSRYENGALQDTSHEKMLRLAMDPRNLAKLLETKSDFIPADKRERLIGELATLERESFSFEKAFETFLGNYQAGELSGYQRWNLTKIMNAFIVLASGGVLKTKLLKLLFYADFKHFKEHTVSITGLRYVHLPYGPVPDKHDYYLASLQRQGVLKVAEKVIGEYSGEEFTPAAEPDLSVFSEGELKTLKLVVEKFKGFSSARISKYSHAETAYKGTSPNELISYQYAEHLSI